MGDEPILRIEGVTKDYRALKAVDNISFSINSGKIVGLLGPNGAGKTTTINMILGILEPTQGSIEIFGEKSERRPFQDKQKHQLCGGLRPHARQSNRLAEPVRFRPIIRGE